VAIARGEQEYFEPNGIPTATEACKSNALVRCCKDLGIASDLWWELPRLIAYVSAVANYFLTRDPRFVREFKAGNCVEVFAEHIPTGRK
jgi:hypothetical protein